MSGHNKGPRLDPYRARLHAGPDGWVRVDRRMRDHWLVGFGQPVPPMDPDAGALSRAEAWQDLIMECRFEEGAIYNGGRKMILQPGQLVGAVSWLAKRWNWTPKTVRGWLDKLETDGMISVTPPGIEDGKQKGTQAQVVTVCNYSEYQIVSDEEGQAKGNAEGTQGASKGHAKGNIYKDNKGTREQGNKTPPNPPAGGDVDPVTVAFEEWWVAFPGSVRKVAKGECASLFRQAVTGKRVDGKKGEQKILNHGRVSAADLIAAAKAYATKAEKQIDADYIVSPAAWLNQGRWLDGSEGSAPAAPWWTDPEKVRQITDDQWRGSIARHANGIWPPDKLGPAPGSPRCVVPKHIIAELRLTEKYDSNGISRERH